MDCAGAIRADPKKKLLTQDLRCEEDVQAKLTNDRLLQEKVEAEFLLSSSSSSSRLSIQFDFDFRIFETVVVVNHDVSRGGKRWNNNQCIPLGTGEVRKAYQKDVSKRRT